jgi:murein DD-endopeptidase MepM/ murein hydrolase activator NlpD
VRRIGILATITVTALTGLVLGGGPASASDTDVVGTVNVDGEVLNVRSAPNTDGARTGWLADGTKLTIVCQQPGQRIRGSERKTKLWDRLSSGEYVSDAYVHRQRPRPPRCEAYDRAGGSAAEWVLPVSSPVGSEFRTRSRPTHDGVDFPAARNAPIHAIAAGTVTFAGCDPGTGDCDVDGSPAAAGCGWYVEVQHKNSVVTRYCHLVRRPDVRKGDRIGSGHVLGHVGSSGNSSGPHLHFEVHRGTPAYSGNAVDPVRFLRDAGLPIR